MSEILLVDDDVFQLKIIEKLLHNNGYSCQIALSVGEAENILKNYIPDLIISDYEMPDVNGFIFRERLLKNSSLKNVPFLFLTSFNNDDLIQKGLDLRALDYIPKNIPPKQLISKINNLLGTVKEQFQKSLNELKTVAEKLNLKNIPDKAPKLKNFEIEFLNKNFQNYPGGDFIDFITINNRYTFVVLGDVMGKKWGAWFFSFSFLSYVRSAIRLCVFDGDLSLSVIMAKINKVINADAFFADIFSTLSILLIDDEEKTLKYVGAGDLPLLKFNKSNFNLETYKSNGVLLGVFENGEFDEVSIDLSDDEEIYLMTDGVIDFKEGNQNKSSMDLFKTKLIKFIMKNETIHDLENLLFTDKVSQIDDCSFIIIKRAIKNEH